MTRIAVALLALASAYPLTTINGPDEYPDTNVIGRYWRMCWDRWQMSRAYRAERWSWTVHREVLHRLDTWSPILGRWELLMLWANVLLFILSIALLSVLAAVPS
jgi:hypothetical protein